MFKDYNTNFINIIDAFFARVNADECGNKEHQFGETKFYQIGIKLKGATDINYNGKKFDYSDNTVLYLPCENRKDIKYNKQYISSGYGICIFFTSKTALSDTPMLYRCDRTCIPGLFKEILHCYKSRSFLKAKSVFYNILYELDELENDSLETPFKKRVTDYVEALTVPNIHVVDIMNLFDYSSDHFRHKFHKEFDMSPTEYIILRKIEIAKEMLLTSGLGIADISHKSGFSDSNYFSRIFKLKTGYSPCDFRKIFRKFM